jgi:hypothetical protein
LKRWRVDFQMVLTVGSGRASPLKNNGSSDNDGPWGGAPTLSLKVDDCIFLALA